MYGPSIRRALAFALAALVAGGCRAPKPPAPPPQDPPTPEPPVRQPAERPHPPRPPTPEETDAAAWREAEADAKALAAKGDYDAALAELRRFRYSAETEVFRAQAVGLRDEIDRKRIEAEKAHREQARRTLRKTYDEEMAKGDRLVKSGEIADIEAAIRAYEAAAVATDDRDLRRRAESRARVSRFKLRYLEDMAKAEEAAERGDYEAVLRILDALMVDGPGGRRRTLRIRANGEIAKAAGIEALEAGDAETAVRKLEKAEAFGIDVAEPLARARKALDEGAESRSPDER
ncbi:MAG: hypothetical protein ACYS9X_27455 [Planctomycetota bacterium]|jgi:hypothetical protein